MDKKLLEVLACPGGHGQLVYHAHTNELICPGRGLAYPIEGGIPGLVGAQGRPTTDEKKQT